MITLLFTGGIIWTEIAIAIKFVMILFQAKRNHLLLVGLAVLVMGSFWFIGTRALALLLATRTGYLAF